MTLSSKIHTSRIDNDNTSRLSGNFDFLRRQLDGTRVFSEMYRTELAELISLSQRGKTQSRKRVIVQFSSNTIKLPNTTVAELHKRQHYKLWNIPILQHE